MDPKNKDKKWITREGAKKLNNRSFSVSNNNEKNKKISRNRSVNILPSWERKHHHSITKFIKKAPSPNSNVENISKSVASRTENFNNQSVSNKSSLIEQFHDSEETKITLKTKTDLVSNEKCIKDQFQNIVEEPKMTIKPKTEPISQLPLGNFSNSLNHGNTFCSEEMNISQNVNISLNEKNKDCQLINVQKFDISTDHNIHNQQCPFNVSNHIKSDIKYIHKQCFDLNEIFEVPKFPDKVKTLQERLSCIGKSEDINITFKAENINDFKIISLKYGQKSQIIGDLGNVFKCPNFKHKRLSVKERLSKII